MLGPVSVRFPDPRDGWVAGGGVILHTADGGSTWTVQHRGSGAVLGLSFSDAHDGWALTAQGPPLRTSDGGATWAPQAAPEGNPVAMDGEWVVSATGGLWRVGGAAPKPVSAPGPVQAVHFADGAHGWIGVDGRLYGTSDGGAHWTQQLDATAGTMPEFAGGAAQLVFPAAGVGWALFSAGSGHASQKSYALYRTDDGGVHWRQALANRFFSNADQGSAPIGPGGYPMALAAPDPSDAYLAVYSPAGAWVEVTATHDGGQTWGVLAMDTRPAVRGAFAGVGLAFTDARHGWLAADLVPGGQLTVWSTADAGATWAQRYTGGA